MSIELLSCPICSAALLPKTDASDATGPTKTLSCDANHCFDRAKQGYWNLLAVQQKKSKDPGDNAEMVSARRAFLNLGYYQPLAQALSQQLQAIIQPDQTANILDMGCGEGYYTEFFHQYLENHQLFGLDISKHAVKAATQRSKAITWLVASGANMPLKDSSIDIMTVVFSRLMPQAFADKLKTDATLVLVWPTDRHLIELKQAIYDDIKRSKYDPAAELDVLFSVDSITPCTFDFTIETAHDLTALLLMTPHGQKVNSQVRESLTNQLPLSLSFSVNIGCFKKR